MTLALVNSTEPPKKVAATTEGASPLKNGGRDPRAKQTDPPANRPAIHQHEAVGPGRT